MQDEILNQRIIRFLGECPRSKSELFLLIGKTDEVRHALTDLMDEGRVMLATDGYRYELTSGGYCPDPEPQGAA
jgi:hypothetical protein